MLNLSLNYKNALDFFNEEEILSSKEFVKVAHNMLHRKEGVGSDFLGWVDLPIEYNKEEFESIKETAQKIKTMCEVFIVIGIGGSYLGSKAIIETLTHSFYNDLPNEDRKAPKIYFAGNNISSTYMAELMEIIENKEICINVISKSGTTTEPAIAFRILKEHIEKKYGKDGAKERIFATTDKSRGALKSLSNEEGYKTFVIPDDVGGRYSVLTAVGLLPIAVAGIDIEDLMYGAQNAYNLYNNEDIMTNDCYKYAVIRNCLYKKNKAIEIMVNYEPRLHFFTEWWKQLYGESEGKDQKGIFPAGVDFSTDLHSMGQFIQDGQRNLFETVINVEKPSKSLIINNDEKNTDGLNFLSGLDMDTVNKKAFLGTILAHNDGGVPNLVINIPVLNGYYLGNLIYFFEKACGISGYLLGVNPFDQPGVEEYKKNMFALLGKPGFEERKAELEKRLE